MAATIVGAPFAFATIVDDARSFWKSCFGIPDGAPRQNTVEESFCQYVVHSKAELIVDDAASDPRTRGNPSVDAMGVRAWAGFPLVAPDGEVLGSSWTPRSRSARATPATTSRCSCSAFRSGSQAVRASSPPPAGEVGPAARSSGTARAAAARSCPRSSEICDLRSRSLKSSSA